MDKFSLILIDISQWQRVVKMGTFGVKRALDEKFCPSTVATLMMSTTTIHELLFNLAQYFQLYVKKNSPP